LIPVIALTGYLGAGKTTLLNHVLRTPGTRIGVVINDFGALNVDAALVTGQVDEPASITGGCVCCLPDNGGLDAALDKLADPRLDLDAIIVEASGLADPVALARLIRFSGAPVRPGGVIDVLDAVTHFDTVDRDATPPARYRAASLIVVNKLDQIDQSDRDAVLARMEERVHGANPHAIVVGTSGGRIDPVLLYDLPETLDTPGQLSLRDVLLDDAVHAHQDSGHVHADSVTVTSNGSVDPDVLLDLLENPPFGVYRLKGAVAVRHRGANRTYALNLVGTAIDVASAPPTVTPNYLVAIGMDLDIATVRTRLETALHPCDTPVSARAMRRLQRYRRPAR
jgi:G3E family GTPase